MKRFACRQLREALAHALAGGQSLHLHRLIADRRKAPRCFVRAVDRGEDICHYFDQDRRRLEDTARRLGVTRIRVERSGTARQHIDLVGEPLRRALALCGEG